MEKIGAGGCGTVFKAIHRKTNETVAIKFHKEGVVPDTESKMLKEIRAMRGLKRHENLCALYDAVKCKHKQFFLIMEYCPGVTLQSFRDRYTRNGGVPENIARNLLRQIITGVGYMHEQGYVHRDLKQVNIIVNETSNNVKIIDFGVAIKDQEITADGHNMVGTPRYWAPEIFKGSVKYGQKLDIWSIGVLHYSILSLQSPFVPGKSAADFQSIKNRVLAGEYVDISHVSQQASELIRSLLSVDPLRRPTAQEILSYYYFKIDSSAGEKTSGMYIDRDW